MGKVSELRRAEILVLCLPNFNFLGKNHGIGTLVTRQSSGVVLYHFSYQSLVI